MTTNNFRVLKRDTKALDATRENGLKLRQREVSEGAQDKLAKARHQAASGATQLQKTIEFLLEHVANQEERILALELKK